MEVVAGLWLRRESRQHVQLHYRDYAMSWVSESDFWYPKPRANWGRSSLLSSWDFVLLNRVQNPTDLNNTVENGIASVGWGVEYPTTLGYTKFSYWFLISMRLYDPDACVSHEIKQTKSQRNVRFPSGKALAGVGGCFYYFLGPIANRILRPKSVDGKVSNQRVH